MGKFVGLRERSSRGIVPWVRSRGGEVEKLKKNRWRCLLEPLVEKLFRRWLLNGRRSFDELRCPVSRCSDLLDTRMLSVSLPDLSPHSLFHPFCFPFSPFSPPLSLSSSSYSSFDCLFVFIGEFVVNLSSTISRDASCNESVTAQ